MTEISENEAIATGAAEAAPRRGRGRPKGDRGAKLLTAAHTLFAQRGYHATSVDEIGEAAGVTGPTLYAHFGGKEAILLALVEGWAGRAEEVIGNVIALGGTPMELAERLIRAQIKLTLENDGLYSIYQQEMHNLPAHVVGDFLTRDRRMRDMWVDIMAPLRPDLATDDVRLLVNGIKLLILGLVSKARPSHSPLDELIVGFVFAGFLGTKATVD